jgi:Holliday junction resolvasome RuvABC DNA-binding subunit
VREDALSALVNLGYKKSTAKTVVDRILDDPAGGLALETILKRALKELS